MHSTIAEHPDVISARRNLDLAARMLDQVERVASQPPATMREVDRARAAHRDAVAALHVARDRAAHEKLTKLEPEYVKTAQELAEAVEKLAPINAKLAELYEEARQINGGRAPWRELALPEFLPPRPTVSTRLSKWLPDLKRYVESKMPLKRKLPKPKPKPKLPQLLRRKKAASGKKAKRKAS